MSRGVIAAIVAGALFGGLVLGSIGTAGTMWVAGALERGRMPVYGRTAPNGVGDIQGQAPGQRGGMMGRGRAQGGAQGGLQGGPGMMGRRGGAAQGAPRFGDPDGAGPLACPQCGQGSTGTVAPGWRR